MSEYYVCPKCNGTKFIGYDDASGGECKGCGHFIPDNELDDYAFVKIKKSELARLKDENHALDQINRDIQTASSHLDEVLAEIVSKDKKLTDYEKELRKLHNYDKTCSTCRYLDENQNCVLGIRCVNYALWQGRIL